MAYNPADLLNIYLKALLNALLTIRDHCHIRLDISDEHRLYTKIQRYCMEQNFSDIPGIERFVNEYSSITSKMDNMNLAVVLASSVLFQRTTVLGDFSPEKNYLIYKKVISFFHPDKIKLVLPTYESIFKQSFGILNNVKDLLSDKNFRCGLCPVYVDRSIDDTIKHVIKEHFDRKQARSLMRCQQHSCNTLLVLGEMNYCSLHGASAAVFPPPVFSSFGMSSAPPAAHTSVVGIPREIIEPQKRLLAEFFRKYTEGQYVIPQNKYSETESFRLEILYYCKNEIPSSRTSNLHVEFEGFLLRWYIPLNPNESSWIAQIVRDVSFGVLGCMQRGHCKLYPKNYIYPANQEKLDRLRLLLDPDSASLATRNFRQLILSKISQEFNDLIEFMWNSESEEAAIFWKANESHVITSTPINAPFTNFPVGFRVISHAGFFWNLMNFMYYSGQTVRAPSYLIRLFYREKVLLDSEGAHFFSDAKLVCDDANETFQLVKSKELSYEAKKQIIEEHHLRLESLLACLFDKTMSSSYDYILPFRQEYNQFYVYLLSEPRLIIYFEEYFKKRIVEKYPTLTFSWRIEPNIAILTINDSSLDDDLAFL